MTEVSVKNGNITVGSTSGTLKAVTKSGNVDVNVSQHDNVTLETKTGTVLKLGGIVFAVCFLKLLTTKCTLLVNKYVYVVFPV